MTLFFDLIRLNGHLPVTSGFGLFIYLFTQIIGLLFCLLYFHQFIFIAISLFKTAKITEKNFYRFHTIGIVIAARNESSVIKNLIDSVRANDYPQAMVKIFVVADNCTDNTAQICRDLGCVVIERFNKEKVGKGYALNYLFNELHTNPKYSEIIPEAYIVLDADNLIKQNYITEMNKMYDCGHKVIASYRNTKNFGQNWLTSGYAFWFIHDSRHMNNARMITKNSCIIAGTGFLISQEVVKEYNNWEFFTLTEDIEFSTTYALSKRKVAYCSSAEFFDEQPASFKQAWTQRERWARGYYQVFGLKGKQLFKDLFKNFSCFDTLTNIFPAMILSLLAFTVLPICSIVALCLGDMANLILSLQMLALMAGSLYLVMLMISVLTLITEWKKIKASGFKKVLYAFTFPFFMMTYIPISVTAMFKKVKWKPIVHNSDVKIEDLNSTEQK